MQYNDIEEKVDLLLKLNTLEIRGAKLLKKYTINDPIEELKYAYDLLIKQLKREQELAKMESMIRILTTMNDMNMITQTGVTLLESLDDTAKTYIKDKYGIDFIGNFADIFRFLVEKELDSVDF